MSLDDIVKNDEYVSREEMIEHMKKEVNNKNVEHHSGSIDKMSAKDIEFEEARIAAAKREYKNIEQLRGSIDKMSAKDIEFEEARIAAAKREYKNVGYHSSSIDEMSAKDIEFEEARIAAAKREYKNVEDPYGSRENEDDSTNAINMANNKARLEGAEPAKAFLGNLLENPTIQDSEQFSKAVEKSLEVKEVMRYFTDGLFDKMREKAFELKNVDKNDVDKISGLKEEIEKYGEIYFKYMYKLKDAGYGFNDEHSLEMPENIVDNLFQNQKELNDFFKMSLVAKDKEGNEKNINLNMISVIRDMNLGLKGPNKSPKINIGRHILKQEVVEKMDEYKSKTNQLNELKKQKGDNEYVK